MLTKKLDSAGVICFVKVKCICAYKSFWQQKQLFVLPALNLFIREKFVVFSLENPIMEAILHKNDPYHWIYVSCILEIMKHENLFQF